MHQSFAFVHIRGDSHVLNCGMHEFDTSQMGRDNSGDLTVLFQYSISDGSHDAGTASAVDQSMARGCKINPKKIRRLSVLRAISGTRTTEDADVGHGDCLRMKSDGKWGIGNFSLRAWLGQETGQNSSQTDRSKTDRLLTHRPRVIQMFGKLLYNFRMAGRQILLLMRIRFQIK